MLEAEIVQHGAAGRFKSLCEELEGYVSLTLMLLVHLTVPFSLLHEIQQELGKLHEKSTGFRVRLKKLTRSTSIKDSLAGYKARLDNLCTRFTVSYFLLPIYITYGSI
jgi:hypothetical protein